MIHLRAEKKVEVHRIVCLLQMKVKTRSSLVSSKTGAMGYVTKRRTQHGNVLGISWPS